MGKLQAMKIQQLQDDYPGKTGSTQVAVLIKEGYA